MCISPSPLIFTPSTSAATFSVPSVAVMFICREMERNVSGMKEQRTSELRQSKDGHIGILTEKWSLGRSCKAKPERMMMKIYRFSCYSHCDIFNPLPKHIIKIRVIQKPGTVTLAIYCDAVIIRSQVNYFVIKNNED